MIYVIFGTFAEHIKLFPLLEQFEKHGVMYKLVHTGQHGQMVYNNIRRLKTRIPDYILIKKPRNLQNISQMLVWILKVTLNARRLPITQGDIVIIHGCAVSTLLGFFIGKWHRAKIIHVESGKLTHRLFDPFPEEIIYRFLSRFSDYCFPADNIDASNLSYRTHVYDTGVNTVMDSIKTIVRFAPSGRMKSITKSPYVLFLARRQETILVKRNLELIVEILELLLKQHYRVIWPIHTSTLYELKSKHIWGKILKFRQGYNLTVTNLFDYVDFIHLLSHCRFVVTDASGVQEEAYFLNKPTLILRKTSANPGIGETAMLSYLDIERVKEFLKIFSKLKRTRRIPGNPSKVIFDVLKKQLSI